MKTNIAYIKGFSLIEVMVSLVIGLVSLLLVVNIYTGTRESHVQNDRMGEVLENGRYAMDKIATDLQTAGFFGGIIDSSKLTLDSTLSLAVDCGKSTDVNWAYDITTAGPMKALYQPNTATAGTEHTCITSAEFVTGTDILTVKRTFGDKETGSLVDNTVYLRSDNATACLWLHGSGNSPGGSSCPTSGFDDWRYLVNIYFIRPYARTAGDGIPTLCKKSLGTSVGGPAMQTVCLAEGIERFHVEFGIDTDSDRDGVANQFVDNPTAAQLLTAVSARIHVLARARRENDAFANTKTFTLGSDTFSVNDSYYRRVYSTTVMLKNLANMAGM